jgi:RND superfamily putative drug exporter
VPVVTVPEGQTVQQRRADVDGVFAALREQVPGLRVVDLASTGDERFVTADGRSAYALVQGPPPRGIALGFQPLVVEAVERAAAEAGLTAGTTSYALLSEGDSGEEASTSVLVETLLGAVGALLVLAFVFASLLAFVPIIVAAFSILTTFALVLLLSTVTEVTFVVQFLISLVGLGVAIDYSLLLVTRWREERAHGLSNDEAVVRAVVTAGHAVLASGITVAISLLALVVLPVPLLRSMGIGGMLIPLVSVAVCLTLLPVLLSKAGPRVDWPRIRKEGDAARGWSRWAALIVRRRFVAAGIAVVALAVLAAPVLGVKIGQSGSGSLSRSGPAYEALQVLQRGEIGTGVLTPITVLVPAGQQEQAARAAAGVDGVLTAAVGEVRGERAVVDVVPDAETLDSTAIGVVADVRSAVTAVVDGGVGVTGAGANVEDYGTAVYDNFPYVLALIALITFPLLVRTFRSIVLPLKAVLLNFISLAAVFGAVVFFWQDGNGSSALFGVSGVGAITFWVPVVIFAFLFGLSMDYEVFILARMREEYDESGSTSAAVITGLGRTGRLVTSAALILFFAFIALATAPGTDIKVLGTALGVGILIDATIVRALLVPALVSAFGRWNWWLPTGLATVLRVAPSPLAPKRARRLVPWRRACRRSRSKASSMPMPARALRTPFACSTSTRLRSACCSWSASRVRSRMLRSCSRLMLATSAMACPTDRSSALSRTRSRASRVSVPMTWPRTRMGSACDER